MEAVMADAPILAANTTNSEAQAELVELLDDSDTRPARPVARGVGRQESRPPMTGQHRSLFDAGDRSTRIEDGQIVAHLVPSARYRNGRGSAFKPDDGGRLCELINRYAERLRSYTMEECSEHGDCHRFTWTIDNGGLSGRATGESRGSFGRGAA